MKAIKEQVLNEVRLLDKKCELLRLRIDESGNTQRAELLRVTGRELWSCARRLESIFKCKNCNGLGEVKHLGESKGCPECKGTGDRLIFE